MARKPMLRVPVDPNANPRQRFDHLLTGLLGVKKTEIQEAEQALKRVIDAFPQCKTRRPKVIDLSSTPPSQAR
jgi:hypothetical protein